MSILTRAGNLIISLISQLASAATGPSSRVLRVMPLDQFGHVISGGGGGGATSTYRGVSSGDAADFKVVRASATELTISEMTYHAIFSNFVEVWEFDAGNLIAKWQVQDTDFTWTWTPAADKSGGTLALATAAFGAASTFVVIATGPPKDDLDLLAILGGPGIHRPPLHFDAVRTNDTDITIGGVTPMLMDPDQDDFIAVKEFDSTGHERMTYTRREWTWNWTPGATGEGVLEIAGATIQAGSTLAVFVQGPEHDTKVLSAAGDAAARGKITQHQDGAGKIQPAGADAASAITMIQLSALMGMSGDGIYRSGIHFTASQNAPTKIDISGGFPSIVNVGQFVGVGQISSGGVVTIFYPHQKLFAWDTVNNQLDVTGATFAVTDVFVMVIVGPNRYAADPGNHLLQARVNADRLMGDDRGSELITGAQTITDTWADLGAPQDVYGLMSASIFVVVDINDDEGIQIRALVLHEPGGASEYELPILNAVQTSVNVRGHLFKFSADADQLMALSAPMAPEVPAIQWQVRRLVDGAGVDSQIDSAHGMRSAV